MQRTLARYTKVCLVAGALSAGALLALTGASASAQSGPDDHSMPGMAHGGPAPAPAPPAPPAGAAAAPASSSSAAAPAASGSTAGVAAAKPATAVAADPRYTG
jgi:hypothetical protein